MVPDKQGGDNDVNCGNVGGAHWVIEQDPTYTVNSNANVSPVPILVDIGSISSSASGTNSANNGFTWARNFTKSFFTFAGGPGKVPTCAGQALRHIGEILNPFTLGVSTATGAAAPMVQALAINQGIAQTQAGIDTYITARGLTVPLRSSVVRAMAAEGAEGAVAAGVRANLAVQTLAVDYAAINSGYVTTKEALNGECAAAFPIF